jgi:hypothetical protein
MDLCELSQELYGVVRLTVCWLNSFCRDQLQAWMNDLRDNKASLFSGSLQALSYVAIP